MESHYKTYLKRASNGTSKAIEKYNQKKKNDTILEWNFFGEDLKRN